MGWAAESSNGGLALDEYQLYWNQGPITNSFVVYSTTSSSVFQATIPDLTSGNPYIFKVRAKNAVGESPFSAEFTIYAATVPNAPNAPTQVAGSNAQTTIDIEWTTANSNGGSTITGY